MAALTELRQPSMFAPGMEEVHLMSNKILAQQLLVTQVRLAEREKKRVGLVGSHGRWKGPCLQTTPDATSGATVSAIADWAC